MKYKVKDNFVYGDKAEAKKGSVIEMDGEEAKACLKAGLIEPLVAEEKKSEELKSEDEKNEKKKGK